MSTTGFLFPGQSTQHRGMGRWIERASPAAAAVFTLGSEVTGRDLRQLCFTTPDTVLARTDNAQLAVFTVNAAAAAMVRERGPRADIVAGHSVGELNALCEAGVVSLSAGFALVAARGSLMATVAATGTMAMLVGLDVSTVEEQVVAVGQRGHGPVVVAIVNGPSNVVISGTADGVRDVSELATRNGGRVIGLRVSGAFHSPLMAGLVPAWREIVGAVPFEAPRRSIVVNTTGRITGEPDELRRAAVDQLTTAVQWSRTSATVVSHATDIRLVETGASKVLTSLTRTLHPGVPVVSMLDPRALRALEAHPSAVR